MKKKSKRAINEDLRAAFIFYILFILYWNNSILAFFFWEHICISTRQHEMSIAHGTEGYKTENMANLKDC